MFDKQVCLDTQPTSLPLKRRSFDLKLFFFFSMADVVHFRIERNKNFGVIAIIMSYLSQMIIVHFMLELLSESCEVHGIFKIFKFFEGSKKGSFQLQFFLSGPGEISQQKITNPSFGRVKNWSNDIDLPTVGPHHIDRRSLSFCSTASIVNGQK